MLWVDRLHVYIHVTYAGPVIEQQTDYSFHQEEIAKSACLVGSFLYGSESWTYKMDLQRKIQAFELADYRKILRVS